MHSLGELPEQFHLGDIDTLLWWWPEGSCWTVIIDTVLEHL